MSEKKQPLDLAREALEQLQAFVSGRVPAWNLPLTEVKAYKADLRPVGRVRLADLQGRLAGCKRWIEYLPKDHDQRAAMTLVEACRRRNARALNHYFSLKKAEAEAAIQSRA